jgi:hypothetical protein
MHRSSEDLSRWSGRLVLKSIRPIQCSSGVPFLSSIVKPQDNGLIPNQSILPRLVRLSSPPPPLVVAPKPHPTSRHRSPVSVGTSSFLTTNGNAAPNKTMISSPSFIAAGPVPMLPSSVTNRILSLQALVMISKYRLISPVTTWR